MGFEGLGFWFLLGPPAKVIHRLRPYVLLCSICSYVPDSKNAYFSLKIKYLTKTKTDKFNPKTDKFNPKTDKFNPKTDKFNPEKSYPQAKNHLKTTKNTVDMS